MTYGMNRFGPKKGISNFVSAYRGYNKSAGLGHGVMSREQFLKGASFVGGAVAAAGLGFGGIARALPTPPNSNIVVQTNGDVWVYPTGIAVTDKDNVQWAVNNVAINGIVVLKKIGLLGQTTFIFPTVSATNNVFITKSCTVTGELGTGTFQFPNGTNIPVPETTITNGSPFSVGLGNSSTFSGIVSIQNIRFEMALVQPIAVYGIGDTVIDNCFFNATQLLFGVIRDTITSHQFGGNLTITNCRILNVDAGASPDLASAPDFAIGLLIWGGPTNIFISNNYILIKSGGGINVGTNLGFGYPRVPVNATIIGNTVEAHAAFPTLETRCIDAINVDQGLIQGNTIIGEGTYGTRIIGSSNLIHSGNDQQGFTATTAQVSVEPSFAYNYIFTVAGNLLNNGEMFTIDDGVNGPVTFVFSTIDNFSLYQIGRTTNGITLRTAAQMATAIRNAINAYKTANPGALLVTPSSSGARVTLINNIPGPIGNNAVIYEGDVIGANVVSNANFFMGFLLVTGVNTGPSNNSSYTLGIPSGSTGPVFFEGGAWPSANYFGPDDENGIPANIIGPIHPITGIAGIIDTGFNNSFVMNDFTMSGIMGKKFGPQVCVLLTETSNNDLVFQSGTFPLGTGGAKDQVTDLGTDNRVVGHPANHVADSKDRGIGQRLKELEAQLAAEQAQVDLSAMGLVWNEETQQWEMPEQ